MKKYPYQYLLVLCWCLFIFSACKKEELTSGNVVINVPGTEANTFTYDLYSEEAAIANRQSTNSLVPKLASGKVSDNKIQLTDLNAGNYVITIYRPTVGTTYSFQATLGKTKEYTF